MPRNKDLVDLNSFVEPIIRLRQNWESFQTTYTLGQPYPHLVIKDLFDSDVLDRIVAEFPTSGNRDWINWDIEHETKLTSRGIAGLSVFTQIFFFWLNSIEFLNELKKIVGINDLVPDPLFFGAGLHEMFQSGWLDVHADYIQHPTLPLSRRINLLIYLNREWNSNWGGDIQLWDRTNHQNKVSYPPNFNRTLIFPTTSQTLHGVPKRNGTYFGAPQDSATAVTELERLRLQGLNFIVFAWPAFWWLEHYTEFYDYLSKNFVCIQKSDRLIIFNLK